MFKLMREQARETAGRVGPLSRFARQPKRLISRRSTSHPRQFVAPGDFYSPIPDLSDVRRRSAQIFDRQRSDVPGIDINADGQLDLLPEFASYYSELPFGDAPAGGCRYGFDNGFFSYGDGIALYSMLRRIQPARFVEVGSGWSSALALDVNERFLGGNMQATFIEPFPDRLNDLLRAADRTRARILDTPLHAVDPSVFGELRTGDLLFIDSTHVSRVGSDVNYLFFEVIPSLPAGVHIHVHDVFWPFEYPEKWVYEGRAWNEDYLLRALLIGNRSLAITWFNDFLHHHCHDKVAAALPLWSKNPGGSIYLRTG